jgi:hypothetical protein
VLILMNRIGRDLGMHLCCMLQLLEVFKLSGAVLHFLLAIVEIKIMCRFVVIIFAIATAQYLDFSV